MTTAGLLDEENIPLRSVVWPDEAETRAARRRPGSFSIPEAGDKGDVENDDDSERSRDQAAEFSAASPASEEAWLEATCTKVALPSVQTTGCHAAPNLGSSSSQAAPALASVSAPLQAGTVPPCLSTSSSAADMICEELFKLQTMTDEELFELQDMYCEATEFPAVLAGVEEVLAITFIAAVMQDAGLPAVIALPISLRARRP
ncbi:hypothetical protein FOA52_004190 [Chlamydomonas sp. UWO 241]|nr:hypothetical protein FOA52_004190 [Chlamydomonas sp. UWO 241]